MQCARCQREAPPDAAFCPECGAPLLAHCAQCGTENVAYEGLLTHRRQALHGGAARALEELHADRLDEVYGALAFHFARSELADKAVAYLILMADASASRPRAPDLREPGCPALR